MAIEKDDLKAVIKELMASGCSASEISEAANAEQSDGETEEGAPLDDSKAPPPEAAEEEASEEEDEDEGEDKYPLGPNRKAVQGILDKFKKKKKGMV